MFKQKSSYLAMIFLTVFFCLTTVAAYAQSSQIGYFDQMEGSTIVGWGWDPQMPNTAVPVRITVTNQETSQVVGDFSPTAAIYRKDLASNGIGNGNHGFRIAMNWNSVPDGTYLIEGWVEDHKIPHTQTYTKGQAKAEASVDAPAPTAGLKSLGIFRTTAYCPCYSCSEGWGRQTSTGATAKARHTIAVDPRVIPYGSKIMINGVIYTAEDRGGGVKGNHIDIFFDTHAQTRQHGSQKTEVFLVQ